MGKSFDCYLSEYMRTIVHRIPGFFVRKDDLRPLAIRDKSDFKATIVTDPVSYLSKDNFLDHHRLEVDFP